MPKTTKPEESAPGVVPAPSFTVVGLAISDHMPILFDGRQFDLANLSESEAAYLLGFPDQVPYLKPAVTAVAND